MYDCDCLIHPFQNDPGTSQSQRVMDDLLSGTIKIDARALADLLDYFVQMSRHINFYDKYLNMSDWQPFFQKSIPFILASVIKTPLEETKQNFDFYNSVFNKKPSSTGLQLEAYFIYYRFINKINNWYLSVKDSGLPIESFLEILIKDKLQQPLKLYIGYTNAAVKWYGIKKIDFSKLSDNPVWNLQVTDLYVIDDSFKTGTYSKFQQIKNLYQKFQSVSSPFFDAIKLISSEAEKNLEPSLLPLKDELQKKHPPHLGLLFAFLNIFRQLQNDLNGFTRKHLDFFYKDVLQIKSRDAIADKAHIIFEIQKQLKKYLIKKGILVKDGKDNNKQEILFSLDDDIVVNKTEVADLRTLFVNNQFVQDNAYIQGVYMAPVANKADGIDKDFKDGEPNNWPTLGGYYSKFVDPENKFLHPYPNARIGFVMASPVLLLNEGERTITINLTCTLKQNYCLDITEQTGGNDNPCCDDNVLSGGTATDTDKGMPALYNPDSLYNDIQILLNGGTAISDPSHHHYSTKGIYYYINRNLVAKAVKSGISKDVKEILEGFLTIKKTKVTDPEIICYCEEDIALYEATVTSDDYENFFPTTGATYALLLPIFSPQSPLRITYSGEKAWITPKDAPTYTFGALTPATGTDNTFTLTIKSSLHLDEPGVSFYNKDALKEDIETTMPVVKIEFNDKIKLFETPALVMNDSCCHRTPDNKGREVSLYHFFRNVLINDTTINVNVCRLKNFIVQNDESLQDVNKPVYPFGTRPDIIDFDVNHTVANTVSVPGYPNPLPSPVPNLIGPNFYIGSKEIFFKNWESLCVNINWKDKPVDFNDFYTAYIKREIPDPINPLNIITILGLNEKDFQVNLSLLELGKWLPENSTSGKGFTNTITKDYNRNFFAKEICQPKCTQINNYNYSFFIERKDFPGNGKFLDLNTNLKEFNSDTLNGFIKFNLQNQDFLHKDYSYVLARQMMAMGKFPDKGVEGAIYLGTGNAVIVFKDTGSVILAVKNEIDAALIKAGATKTEAGKILTQLGIVRDPMSPGGLDITDAEFISKLKNPINQTSTLSGQTKTIIDSIVLKINLLQTLLSIFNPDGTLKDDLSVPIPNEPWTPIISNMSLDYTATAEIEDIDLIHLYPYTDTYKHEEIKLQPTLFPTFCDEGTLFLGLKNLIPGDNLNILFQLAEATSDSESEKEEVLWHYLDNNVWKPLRIGFEILDDATENLTASGIVKFALPANMTNDNTIMPKNLHWIKASIPQNSKAVSETIGIFPQAMNATFTNDAANDKLRLSQPLVAGSISKLNVADANVKSVLQPFDSFDGQVPEIEQQFYVRVSEQLRHKGRAIQKFDYERLALEAFPQLFKVKCINHSFALDAHLYKNDFPYAPGYVILAVIPDLNKLKAGNSFEPKVPVSILEKIETYIRQRTSSFVRFRAMNPRYEKINFCLRVNLLPGKDENYYKEQLKEDLRELLAPWAVGKYDKLTFGQCVYRSDIIRFLEQTDYVDFITDFRFSKPTNIPDSSLSKICPDTPRSIIVAGDIDVCINQPGCDDWKICEDQNEMRIDCCTTEVIPVAEYCIDKTIPPIG